MCEGEGPEAEVGGCVGDRPQHKLYGVDHLWIQEQGVEGGREGGERAIRHEGRSSGKYR